MNYKIIFKTSASRLKKIFFNLISPQQKAYGENRFSAKSSELIADIIEITDIPNKERFLVTMDIKKAFSSLDHIL